MTEGLVFRLESTLGDEDDLAQFLEDRLPETLEDLPLSASFVVRFDLTAFGVFVAFSEEAAEVACDS